MKKYPVDILDKPLNQKNYKKNCNSFINLIKNIFC